MIRCWGTFRDPTLCCCSTLAYSGTKKPGEEEGRREKGPTCPDSLLPFLLRPSAPLTLNWPSRPSPVPVISSHPNILTSLNPLVPAIFRRIHIGNRKRSLAVHLHHDVCLRHRVVMPLSRCRDEPLRVQFQRLIQIDLVPHADQEGAREHRHVLVGGMEMRGELVAGGPLQSNSELTGATRVTLQHGDLGAGREGRRARLEYDLASAGMISMSCGCPGCWSALCPCI